MCKQMVNTKVRIFLCTEVEMWTGSRVTSTSIQPISCKSYSYHITIYTIYHILFGDVCVFNSVSAWVMILNWIMYWISFKECYKICGKCWVKITFSIANFDCETILDQMTRKSNYPTDIICYILLTKCNLHLKMTHSSWYLCHLSRFYYKTMMVWNHDWDSKLGLERTLFVDCGEKFQWGS